MTTDDIEFVPILETHSAGDRVFLKSILDAEGICYYIQGEHVAPYLFHSVPMRLMVRKDQVPAALEILADFVQSPAYVGLKAPPKRPEKDR